jgi:hypothetical protein
MTDSANRRSPIWLTSLMYSTFLSTAIMRHAYDIRSGKVEIHFCGTRI